MTFFTSLQLNTPREGAVDFSSDPSPPKPTPTASKTWGTTVTRVESWPEDAQPLKRHNWLSHLYMVGDVVLIFLPIYFILLGVATAILHNKPTKGDAFGSKVEFAMDLGPTMFPIVFAAICGRSMKMIARYRAEKGAKLKVSIQPETHSGNPHHSRLVTDIYQTLELLMASQSVWGTVESQLLMQRLTLVGVNLLFLWALSPLGGQASLRLMTRANKESYMNNTIRYMTTGPAATVWSLVGAFQGNGQFGDAGALYNAALLSPLSTKIGPRDPWGNVKIPRLVLEGTAQNDDSWEIVPEISHPEAYSSLVGLPIVGLPTNATSNNFTLESTYLSVECGNFTQIPFPAKGGTNFQNGVDWAKLKDHIPGILWSNDTSDQMFGSSDRRASFFIDTDHSSAWGQPISREEEVLLGRLDGFIGHMNQSRLTDTEQKTSRKILYASIYATARELPEFGLNLVTCALAQIHVEVMVDCERDQCAATKIRRSSSDRRPTALTGLEHAVVMDGMARQFPKAINFVHGSSPTEFFLVNSSSFPFSQQTGSLTLDLSFTNVSVVSPDVFSKRLSLLLNTYYQLSTQPTGYWGDLPRNLSAYGPDTLPVTDINKYLPSNLSATTHSFFDWWDKFQETSTNIRSPFIGATTVANTTSSEEVFVCQYAWLVLLLAASVILFITGLAALILKRLTLGPELFGFVTSMTYENPHMRIPEGGSTLDAMERARLLEDVEVFVGDVHGDRDIGHIAFAVGTPGRKLERGRLYA